MPWRPARTAVPGNGGAAALVDTLREVHDVEVDTDPLAAFAGQVGDYYAELQEHLQRREAEMPGDRMFV